VGFLKRFNREQLALGITGVLSALLFGWQLTRGGLQASGGELPNNDRVYSIPRDTPIEFLASDIALYLKGRPIWEPPAVGRLPVPEIRPPEPRLGRITLPPLRPRPDFNEFNRVPLPGKFRTVAESVQGAVPAGFPADAEIAALKDLKEPEGQGVVDKRKQLLRPLGQALVHRTENRPPVTGRFFLENKDGSIVIEEKKGEGVVRTTVLAVDIDRAKPGTDEGVERDWEYEKEYARRASRLKDDDIEAHLKLGRWCRELAGMMPEARLEFTAAIEALRKRNDLGPKMREALSCLVDALRDLGRYADAIQVLQEHIDVVKGTVNDTLDLHLRMGDLYAALAYYERALISYAAAFQLEPGKPVPRVAVARARLDLRETSNALAEIQALLLGGGPQDTDALVVLGLALLRRGQALEAEEAFTKALAARPGDAEALNGLGVALELQGKPEAAAKFLAAIKANQYMVDAWLNLATLYLAAGRPVEAEILLNGAAQRDPDSAAAMAGPGLVAILKGNYAEASSPFERALKVQPDDYYAAYALGRLKLREVKAEEALGLFRASLKSEPDYLPSTNDAALAYLMLARAEQVRAATGPAEQAASRRERADNCHVNAEMLLTMVRDFDPQRANSYVALGCVYAVMGRSAEAAAMFNQGREGGRIDPLIEYGLGYVDYWYGADSPKTRLELAEVKFKYGSTLQPTDPADMEWVKECLESLRRIDEWKVQRIFLEDRFDGNQPSPSVAWIPVQLTVGPQVRYDKERVEIGQAGGPGPAGSLAGLENRDVPRDGFLSAEATFIFENTQFYEAAVSLYTSKTMGGGQAESASGLHFVFIEDPASTPPRTIRLYCGQAPAVRSKGPSRPNRLLGQFKGAPARLRVRIDRHDDPNSKGYLYDFSVWDEKTGGWKSLTDKQPMAVPPSMNDSPTMTLQFWGRSLIEGKKWSFGVDDVRVLVVEK